LSLVRLPSEKLMTTLAEGEEFVIKKSILMTTSPCDLKSNQVVTLILSFSNSFVALSQDFLLSKKISSTEK